MNEKILIIEDDPGVRFFLEEALSGESYAVLSAASYEEAISMIKDSTYLVVMDIKLPGLDGLSAIDEVKKKTDAPILIITAYGTKKNAMEALQRGAADFFVKPIMLEELKVMVKRLLGRRYLMKAIEQKQREHFDDFEFHGVIGVSEAMREIFRTVEKVAERDATVLVTGETGVGKEEIAGLIHKLSHRKGELVIVNCASIPDSLLESELFGFEKGAFTGAHQQKQGKVELADAGTLVLDEIGEMSPSLQAKLLRVIETKEVERLGSVKGLKLDVRIIGTTNRALEREIKEGRFREDLYFRLSQIHVFIPPLRERREDIGALTDAFMLRVSREMGTLLRMDDQTRRVLTDYSWPGNVRELLNVIRRACIMCESSVVTEDELPLYLRSDRSITPVLHSGKSLDEAISELERNLITDALRKTGGAQAKAARLLGITERSMWYRVKKYNLDVP